MFFRSGQDSTTAKESECPGDVGHVLGRLAFTPRLGADTAHSGEGRVRVAPSGLPFPRLTALGSGTGLV